jgi:putative transcriptional regulator
MKKENFDELLASVRQAGAMKRGERKASRVFKFTPLDVRKIREKIGLSQTQFSELIHVSIKTLQNWEQGRRQPNGPALALLMILKKDPKHAIEALR